MIGNYIVDFYCPKAKLVIELDGSQHFEQKGQNHDKMRTEYLIKHGLMVMRFSNDDIKYNFRGVCEHIDHYFMKWNTQKV